MSKPGNGPPSSLELPVVVNDVELCMANFPAAALLWSSSEELVAGATAGAD